MCVTDTTDSEILLNSIEPYLHQTYMALYFIYIPYCNLLLTHTFYNRIITIRSQNQRVVKYMNTQKCDILNLILSNTYTNQRTLAEDSGHSLGIVNRSIKALIAEGYLDESSQPTQKAIRELTEASPKRAIILAAGFGMRMVPINTEAPKGLLEVHGEPLIERQIRQLHAAGIHEIYIVVG